MALIDVFNLRHQAEFRARLIGAGALAHTGNADLFKADVSNLGPYILIDQMPEKYNDPAWVWMRFRQ